METSGLWLNVIPSWLWLLHGGTLLPANVIAAFSVPGPVLRVRD